MFTGPISSWNLRDSHMAGTLERLIAHLEDRGTARTVVWAHNSHVGDARADVDGPPRRAQHRPARPRALRPRCRPDRVHDLHRDRQRRLRLGRGRRAQAGPPAAAGQRRGAPRRGRARAPSGCACATTAGRRRSSTEPRLERAIGVIYRPENELVSHYFEAHLSEQFDYVDPLRRDAGGRAARADRRVAAGRAAGDLPDGALMEAGSRRPERTAGRPAPRSDAGPMHASFSLGRWAGVEIGVNWSWVVIFGLIALVAGRRRLPGDDPGPEHRRLRRDGGDLRRSSSSRRCCSTSSATPSSRGARAWRSTGSSSGCSAASRSSRACSPRPGAELRIAIAGPVVSLVIGVSMLALATAPLPDVIDGVVAWLGSINLILLVFNMLPGVAARRRARLPGADLAADRRLHAGRRGSPARWAASSVS